MSDNHKTTTGADSTGIVAEFQLRFADEFRGLSDRLRVMLPGDEPGNLPRIRVRGRRYGGRLPPPLLAREQGPDALTAQRPKDSTTGMRCTSARTGRCLRRLKRHPAISGSTASSPFVANWCSASPTTPTSSRSIASPTSWCGIPRWTTTVSTTGRSWRHSWWAISSLSFRSPAPRLLLAPCRSPRLTPSPDATPPTQTRPTHGPRPSLRPDRACARPAAGSGDTAAVGPYRPAQSPAPVVHGGRDQRRRHVHVDSGGRCRRRVRRARDGDRGDEPVTGDRDVRVTLRDDDESNRPPKFGQERYEFDLPENRSRREAPVVLGTVAARDSDRLDGRTSLVVADQLGNKLLGRGGHALGTTQGLVHP